jgi:hypothetical protein
VEWRSDWRVLSGRESEEELRTDEDEEVTERRESERDEIVRLGNPGSLARCVAAAMIDCTYWLSGIAGSCTLGVFSFLYRTSAPKSISCVSCCVVLCRVPCLWQLCCA